MYPGCKVYHSVTRHVYGEPTEETSNSDPLHYRSRLKRGWKKLGNLSLKDFRGVFAFSVTQRGVKVYYGGSSTRWDR